MARVGGDLPLEVSSNYNITARNEFIARVYAPMLWAKLKTVAIPYL